MTSPSPDVPNDAESLLRCALEIFDGFAELLEAMSPAETQAAVLRKNLAANDAKGREHAFLKAYEARHRLFTLAFGRQRSLFAQLTREWMNRPVARSGG